MHCTCLRSDRISFSEVTTSDEAECLGRFAADNAPPAWEAEEEDVMSGARFIRLSQKRGCVAVQTVDL